MTRPGKPPRFKPFSPPGIKRIVPPPKPRYEPGEERDWRWAKLSIRFRKQNPFCFLCEQEGRMTPADVANHILPWREYPELRYVWKNLCSLCGPHHNVTVQRLEQYARENGLLDKLPEWYADPQSRPPQFRPLRTIS